MESGQLHMRSIFCFVNEPVPIAAAAVKRYAPDSIWIDTSGNIYAYNEAIAEHWTGEDDLLVIEGDKEITADVVPSMSACGEPWCAYSYINYPAPYQKTEIYGLGCTKYSASTQRQIAVDEWIGPDPEWQTPCNICGGKGCWQFLDTRIAINILSKCISFSPHVHGAITHHHPYPDDWAAQRGLNGEALYETS